MVLVSHEYEKPQSSALIFLRPTASGTSPDFRVISRLVIVLALRVSSHQHPSKTRRLFVPLDTTYLRLQELNLPPEKWGMMGLGNWLMEKQAPVVEKALRTLRVEVDTRLHATTKTLQELNLPNNERSENLRIIRTIIRSVESRFRTRAGVAAVNRELNIALITNDLYKAFKNEIENDTQKWLRADFIPTVQAHIANHSGQDPLVQLVNAEISLFQTWFQLQEPVRGVGACH